MINTKDDIWVEGFDTNSELYVFKDSICFVGEPVPYIYIGKTSEIPEELAKECVEGNNGEICPNTMWLDYRTNKNDFARFHCKTPKESIQSALIKPDGTIYPFCIIFKK